MIPMQWVDIGKFDPEKKGTTALVRFVLDAGQFRREGDAVLGEKISSEGVFSSSLGRQVFPADGEAFLYGLGEEYRSAYFFASDVQEGAAPPPLS